MHSFHEKTKKKGETPFRRMASTSTGQKWRILSIVSDGRINTFRGYFSPEGSQKHKKEFKILKLKIKKLKPRTRCTAAAILARSSSLEIVFGGNVAIV